MSLIFKDLEKGIKQIISEQKVMDKTDKVKERQLKEQRILLDEVVSYIKSYEWLKHERTIERVKFFLKNKYDYTVFCKYFDITYDAAKVSISYANQKAREKIGENTVELILDGKIEEAKALFYFRSGQLKLRSFIVDSALPIIPQAAYMNTSIKDCETELKFLTIYTESMLEKRVDAIDADKLAFLRYVLEGDNPKLTQERVELVGLLKSKVDVKQYLESVDHREIY